MEKWLLRHRCRVIVHRIRFPGAPMFSEAAVRDLLGKRVLVGVTHLTYDGRPLGQEQLHGRLVRASLKEGLVLQTPSGAEIRLPPDLRGFVRAKRGHYTLRTSGETVADPDLTTLWTYRNPPPARTGESTSSDHS